MKKLLLLLTLLLIACQPALAPVTEAPQKVTPSPPIAPSTPSAPPTVAPPVSPADCKTDCMDSCVANTDKVCGQNTDWYGCLDNCNGYLRAEGCKAVCQSEAYEECVILFKGECKQECNKKCA